MNLQKRALYNSLRMNWLIDPSLEVDAWQIENYREMSLPLIFGELKKYHIHFSKESFTAYANNFDTPEDLVDDIIAGQNLAAEDEDHIYLLLFELWRRFETDKPCLSIFCDELDHQIFLHDRSHGENSEGIEDAVANLQVILNENMDQGGDPIEILQFVNQGCANNIESFLYDYISQQIENGNFSYASELIENFIEYVSDTKWFDLLQVKILSESDHEGKSVLLKQLIKDAKEEKDLEFSLEILFELRQEADTTAFVSLVKNIYPLIKEEEDFQDLISICADYFYAQEKENEEVALIEMLEKRKAQNIATFDNKTEDGTFLLNILEKNNIS